MGSSLTRRHAFLSAGLLCVSLSAEAGTPPAENDDAVAACRGCHQGALALDRFEVDDLTSRLKAVRDGETPHPPLNLDDDDDCTLGALARRLVEGGSGA